MNHFCYLKKLVRWDRYKSLVIKKKIYDHNKFNILSEELGNEELSVEKLINITNSIVKDLLIISSRDIFNLI